MKQESVADDAAHVISIADFAKCAYDLVGRHPNRTQTGSHPLASMASKNICASLFGVTG